MTSVAVFKGITRVCDLRRRNCGEQQAGCSVAVVGQGSLPRPVVDPAECQQQLRRNFLYVRSQQSLWSEFRVNTAICLIANVVHRHRIAGAPRTAVAGRPTTSTAPPPPAGSPSNRSGLSGGSNPGLGKGHNEGSGANNSGNGGAKNRGGGG